MSYGNGNKDRYYFRMIYDLTWFLFIQVTFMNIIFGIIIDTFAGWLFRVLVDFYKISESKQERRKMTWKASASSVTSISLISRGRRIQGLSTISSRITTCGIIYSIFTICRIRTILITMV
jgi:hypothetical protein